MTESKRRVWPRKVMPSRGASILNAEGAPQHNVYNYLVKHPTCTFLVWPQSDNLIASGIKPGSVLIVDDCRPAYSGDIVVIRDNQGAYFVRRLRLSRGVAYFSTDLSEQSRRATRVTSSASPRSTATRSEGIRRRGVRGDSSLLPTLRFCSL